MSNGAYGAARAILPAAGAPSIGGVKETTLSEALYNRLLNASDRLAADVISLETVADKFFGPQPQSDVTNSGSPSASTVASQFDVLGERIHLLLNRLEDVTFRIKKI